jgi:hypothetical protein
MLTRSEILAILEAKKLRYPKSLNTINYYIDMFSDTRLTMWDLSQRYQSISGFIEDDIKRGVFDE